MKIIIIGSTDFDTLEYHLSDSFANLGHDVKIIDLKNIVPLKYVYNYHAIKYSRIYDKYIFQKISKEIVNSNPDLVIGTYRFINPDCIAYIKKKLPCIPVIHVNPDALTTFEMQQIFASPYDYYFTKDPYIVDFMQNKMNLKAFYLPEAFNPRVHTRPDINRTYLEGIINIDILVFGYLYPYRVNMIKKLVSSGLNVTLYGKKDKRFFDPTLELNFKNEWIAGKRKAELLNGAKIVFNNFHYAEIMSVNCKFFEIFGAGGFQICDYRQTIDEYSKNDPKEFTFHTIDEAIDLIKFYIDKPQLRHELADSQYQHFLVNHTYEHRTNRILEVINNERTLSGI